MKATPEAIEEMKRLRKKGMSQRQIASQIKISQAVVSFCLRGIRRTRGGHIPVGSTYRAPKKIKASDFSSLPDTVLFDFKIFPEI